MFPIGVRCLVQVPSKMGIPFPPGAPNNSTSAAVGTHGLPGKPTKWWITPETFVSQIHNLYNVTITQTPEQVRAVALKEYSTRLTKVAFHFGSMLTHIESCILFYGIFH